MRTTLKALFIVFAAGCFAACGGEEIETVDCTEGTSFDEEAGECIAEETQCADNEEFVAEFNACARVNDDFCADDTEFVDGECVANADLECGEDTAAEDGECVVSTERECGEGTVVYDGQCVPDDICDEGTADVSDDEDPTLCRPINEACGEGTVFDVSTRTCIRSSHVECGIGTTADSGICIPTYNFYSDMADNPDLDMSVDGASGNITLADTGELFSFVGNIDAPETVDDQQVQDEDVYTFDADAGQWLRITVFSLGLPEPGFRLTGDDDFHRLSDLGVGLEVSRQVLIPADGSYELSVSNLPQMLENYPPAGGDDWNYVGYIETLETPDSTAVDIFDETLNGDIRQLSSNYYAVDDMDGVEDVQMLFGSIPEDAAGELQVWSDTTTLETTVDLDSLSLSIVPPADSFYLVFDYDHAHGSSTSYSLNAVEAQPLDAGDSISEDVALDAGDYIGVFQYNTANQNLSASITDADDTVVAHTNELAPSISVEDDDQVALYWYADEATTVTVDIENSTGSDLSSVSYQLRPDSADAVDVVDGSLQLIDYDQAMQRGQRHYFDLDVTYDDILLAQVTDASADALVYLEAENGDQSVGFNQIGIPGAQNYQLIVEAEAGMGTGFSLSIEETDSLQVEFDETQTLSPSLIVETDDPIGQGSTTMDVVGCNVVQDLSLSTVVSSSSDGWTDVFLHAPGLDDPIGVRTEGNHDGHTTTYPDQTTPDEPFDAIFGTGGTGTWELEFENRSCCTDIHLDEWTLHLTCTI